MKNNILLLFAFKDLKSHKKDTVLAMITIFIVSMMAMMITLCTPFIANSRFIEHQYQNGTYDYSQRINLENLQYIKFNINQKSYHYQDLNYCFKKNLGTTVFYEELVSLKGNSKIIATNIIEGKMPQKKGEIALQKKILKQWGWEEKLGTQIELPYDNGHQSTIGKFTIVGILEATGGVHIVVSDDLQAKEQESEFFVDIAEDETLENASELGLSNGLVLEDYLLTETSQSILFLIIQIVIGILAFSLIYGLTLSSYEKRQKDYTLLRSIGVTKRQLYFVLFVQVLMMSIVSIMLSMIITYIISCLLPLMISLPVPLSFEFKNMLYNGIVVFCVAFISFMLPAKSANKMSLSGTFDGQEFQYFYYRYKNEHILRPSYLGWRQLVSLKKKMFMKIFFIGIITLSCMNIINDYSLTKHQLQKQNEIVVNEELCFIPKEDEYIHKEDFDFIESSKNQIDFFESVSMETFVDENSQIPSSMFSYAELYCDNDYFARKYELNKLQEGEIILSKILLESIGETTKIGDTIELFNKTYTIKGTYDDYGNSIVLSKNDFQQFGKSKNITEVMISFDNVQEKREFLVQYHSQIPIILEKYNNIQNVVEQGDVSWDYAYLWQNVLIIITVGIIYIYQFVFELLRQREDIGSYQLLGLTKIEIWKIYFSKALYIGIIGFLIGGGYYFADTYVRYRNFDFCYIFFEPMTVILTLLLSLVVIVVIILIPLSVLFSMTKKNGLENKTIHE